MSYKIPVKIVSEKPSIRNCMRIESLAEKFDGIKLHWTCLHGAWHEIGCRCVASKGILIYGAYPKGTLTYTKL